jgi:pimeloyl-ACP methyl ester carboxylesterase
MELTFSLWGESKESDKPRIVFLHGMGGTGALWRPIAASLEEKIQILAPDQRGHGKSIVPDISGGRSRVGYTPLDYGRDVVETLNAQEFHPTWIVGHSMGVRTACAIAHLKRAWVRGLVLVDLGFSGVAGGGLGEGLGQFIQKLPKRFDSREQARQFMAENCPDPAIAQYLMAVSIRASDGGLTFPFDQAALVQTIQAARDVSVADWVREAAEQGMPILVLRGARSLVWTHEEFEKLRAEFAPYPSIRFQELEGAGHGLPFEKRLEFVGLLERFIEGRRS